jgi:hypothetical protein
MNKLSSPSGISISGPSGILAGLSDISSIVVLCVVGFGIGIAGFNTVYKNINNNTEEIPRTSFDSEYSSSSMFDMPEEERGSSMSDEEPYNPTQYEVTKEMLKNNKHKIVEVKGVDKEDKKDKKGGKRSKKRRRKNKSKKRNTLKK